MMGRRLVLAALLLLLLAASSGSGATTTTSSASSSRRRSAGMARCGRTAERALSAPAAAFAPTRAAAFAPRHDTFLLPRAVPASATHPVAQLRATPLSADGAPLHGGGGGSGSGSGGGGSGATEGALVTAGGELRAVAALWNAALDAFLVTFEQDIGSGFNVLGVHVNWSTGEPLGTPFVLTAEPLIEGAVPRVSLDPLEELYLVAFNVRQPLRAGDSSQNVAYARYAMRDFAFLGGFIIGYENIEDRGPAVAVQVSPDTPQTYYYAWEVFDNSTNTSDVVGAPSVASGQFAHYPDIANFVFLSAITEANAGWEPAQIGQPVHAHDVYLFEAPHSNEFVAVYELEVEGVGPAGRLERDVAIQKIGLNTTLGAYRPVAGVQGAGVLLQRTLGNEATGKYGVTVAENRHQLVIALEEERTLVGVPDPRWPWRNQTDVYSIRVVALSIDELDAPPAWVVPFANENATDEAYPGVVYNEVQDEAFVFWYHATFDPVPPPTTGVPTTGVATTGVATTGVATTGVATTGVATTVVATTGMTPTTTAAAAATTGTPAATTTGGSTGSMRRVGGDVDAEALRSQKPLVAPLDASRHASLVSKAQAAHDAAVTKALAGVASPSLSSSSSSSFGSTEEQMNRRRRQSSGGGEEEFNPVIRDFELRGRVLCDSLPFRPCTYRADEAGYRCVDTLESHSAGSVTYNWRVLPNSTSVTTELRLQDDALSVPIELPFAVNFYGRLERRLLVGSNGYLTFVDYQLPPLLDWEPQPFPFARDPNGTIAGLWTDMDASLGGSIRYATLGVAPTRVFVVEYDDVPRWLNFNNRMSFQVVLSERTSDIEMHIRDAPNSGGALQAIGIENRDASIGSQYFYGGTNLPAPPLAVRFLAPAPVPATTGVDPTTGYVVPGDCGGGAADAFGYTCTDSRAGGVTYDFIPGLASLPNATRFFLGDDDVSPPLLFNDVPGFGSSFPFYGQEHDRVWLSSNGFLTFVNDGEHGCCSGRAIPNTAPPNSLIAGYWTDLDPTGVGATGIYWAPLGPRGGRGPRMVVEVGETPHFGSADAVAFQFHLFPNGDIELHYRQVPRHSAIETVGLEGPEGRTGLEYHFGAVGFPDAPHAIKFLYPTQSPEASASSSVEPDGPAKDSVLPWLIPLIVILILLVLACAIGLFVYHRRSKRQHAANMARARRSKLQGDVALEDDDDEYEDDDDDDDDGDDDDLSMSSDASSSSSS